MLVGVKRTEKENSLEWIIFLPLIIGIIGLNVYDENPEKESKVKTFLFLYFFTLVVLVIGSNIYNTHDMKNKYLEILTMPVKSREVYVNDKKSLYPDEIFYALTKLKTVGSTNRMRVDKKEVFNIKIISLKHKIELCLKLDPYNGRRYWFYSRKINIGNQGWEEYNWLVGVLAKKHIEDYLEL